MSYIRQSMEILLQLKEDTHQPKDPHSVASSSSTVSKPSPPPEYEQMIQKLEGEVRQHIRVSLVYTIRVGGAADESAHGQLAAEA